MNPVVACAETTLRQHPDPAVRLTELLRSVAPITDRSLTAGRLRSMLEDHPERFRILDSWDSRWLEPESNVPSERAWVVSLSPGTDPPDGEPSAGLLREAGVDPGRADGGRTDRLLRESFRWVSRDIDVRSRLALSRWSAIRRALVELPTAPAGRRDRTATPRPHPSAAPRRRAR